MAFDWIESHRGLRDHPKTVTLTAALGDRKPCVIGHLQELWWWTLEYAPDGIIRTAFIPQVVAACEWHGKAEKFWSALVESGFVESLGDGNFAVHDWVEYAKRRVERHEKETVRKQAWRAKAGRAGIDEPDAPAGRPEAPPGRAGGASPTRAGHQPDLPDRDTAVSLSSPDLPPQPPDGDADAQGPSGTASARSQSQMPPPKWEEVAPGQHRGSPNGVGEISLLTARCPRCERSMPVDEVENHDCELVPGEPVQTPPQRRRGGRGFHRLFEPSEAVPPEVRAELERMERERPTPEEIAAEVARIGQQPR